MKLSEKIKRKNSRNNRVTISAVVSEEINGLLEKTAADHQHATKELLIEIAIEEFLERYQSSSDNLLDDDDEPLFIED